MRNHNPLIILSRTAPEFLARLFEQEVPEVFDGLITIKNIVRVPGERAKVAVESYDERIDPVGACVGMKGARIHGIVRELRNENIDVINYTENTQLYITRALNPAKISSIKLDEETKKAEVYLDPDQVSLAIGKGGFNIRLASMLTNFEIDVYRDIDEADDDVELTEFTDEIEDWIIDALKAVGCDTAKDVLQVDQEELIERVENLLSSVGLKNESFDKYPHELSGGMRKRVGLARALALRPKIMLYDEPTTGLDPITTKTVNDLIYDTANDQSENELTSIIISHDVISVINYYKIVCWVWINTYSIK